MTNDQIIEMAKERGFYAPDAAHKKMLIAFARLIAEKQCEIDVQLCLSVPIKTARQGMREACANAIRSQQT